MINIISFISLIGITGLTTALVVVLSVFNGFDEIVQSLFNKFDPDLKIQIKEGKSFILQQSNIDKIKGIEGIQFYTETVEETALFQYSENQFIAKIKGVDSNFVKSNQLCNEIFSGEFNLNYLNRPSAVVGIEIANALEINTNYPGQLQIWIPKRQEKITFEVDKAFNTDKLVPAGIFAIRQDYDRQYVILPINFARNLLDYTKECNSIEIKCIPDANIEKIKTQIITILGDKFTVKNRFEQQELLYKIMRSEKWAIFLMLSFILIIASFNVIGSLTMIIMDKKRDIEILKKLGAENSVIRKIFLFEGWMISIIGAIVGIFTGSFISLVQQKFGLLTFPETGAFIIEAYPVKIIYTDLIAVFFTVIFIGFVAAWYPVRYISKKYF